MQIIWVSLCKAAQKIQVETRAAGVCLLPVDLSISRVLANTLLHIYPLIHPEIWLKHPVRKSSGCGYTNALGQPTCIHNGQSEPSLHGVAPPPSVGRFTHLGRCKQRNSQTADTSSALAGGLRVRVTGLNSEGGREWRQNDGDFIPDGHRHVLAANGRDE